MNLLKNTPTVTINELRKRFGEIERKLPFIKHVMITKNGKPIAKITSLERKEKDTKKAWDKYFGILPDFPEVTKYRRSRRKSITL